MKGLYRHGYQRIPAVVKKDQDVLKKDSSLWLDVWKVCVFFVDLVGLFLLESLFGF